METFAQRVKELRKEHGLTRSEFGQRICYHKNTVANWETGRREPTASTLKEICKKFDVSADYLLGLTDY